ILTFQNHTNRPLTDFGGKTSIFSHPVYLFLREFSLQDFRGGSERVVDQRTNGDLKDFLAAQKSGGGNSQPIEVNAPLNINGNVNSSDKMVMDAIKRHAKLVAQAVEDAQRRKM
ncbi:hypothetical protein, partial [Escherichia coli]|uniref:hypothetical protein n=1 Tax=Escherichia coli TaxID=562 RepID=UPI00209ACBFD